MKSLMIKDLSNAQELSREDLAAVRGGNTNLALVGGATQMAGSGFSFGSPVMQLAPQTVTQTNTSVNLASVFGSAATLIAQI